MVYRIVEWVYHHPIVTTMGIGLPVNLIVVNGLLDGIWVPLYSITIYLIIYFGLINITHWLKQDDKTIEEQKKETKK